MLIIIYFVLFASVITIMIKSEFFDHSKCCEKINSLSGQQPEHSSIKFLSVKEYTVIFQYFYFQSLHILLIKK